MIQKKKFHWETHAEHDVDLGQERDPSFGCRTWADQQSHTSTHSLHLGMILNCETAGRVV